jgi:hypothetical protein
VKIAIFAQSRLLEQRIYCTAKLHNLRVNGQFLDFVRHGEAENARTMPSGFEGSRFKD